MLLKESVICINFEWLLEEAFTDVSLSVVIARLRMLAETNRSFNSTSSEPMNAKDKKEARKLRKNRQWGVLGILSLIASP